MKILVVDDSGVMRRIHKNTLLEHKITDEDILEAADGKIALSLAKEHNIGLFLLDWNMPNLDGLSFVKVIREIEQYKTTPVIMITSEAAKYNVVEAINSGVTNYVVKPIQGNTLWEKIQKYIQ